MEFRYDRSLVSREAIEETGRELIPYVKHLSDAAVEQNFDLPEASLCLLDGDELPQKVKSLAAEKAGGSLKFALVVGIGGANLGAKAIYESIFLYADFFGARDRMPEGERAPRLFFADNVNTVVSQEVASLIETKLERPEDILVIVVSKSGSTVETLVNAELAIAALSARFGREAALARCVTITDEDSDFWKRCAEMGITTLPVPHHVGDRFGVFSAEGLLPLAVAGFDIDLIRSRAREIETRCLTGDPAANPAMVSASVKLNLLRQDRTIHDTFLFNPQLESLGKWYRQLMAESLGKRENIEFETVEAGITPTVSIGTTDLHSVAQLYLGGPKDKMTEFVFLEAEDSRKVPSEQTLGLSSSIAGKSAQEVLKAIYEGVKRTYEKESLPFTEVILRDIYDVPAFMQFKMVEIMLLGRLMRVDPFNQPLVELYKAEMRKILKGEA